MPESLTNSPILAFLPGMILLLAVSSFFSGSEAAFFSLTLSQRRTLNRSGRTGVVALGLLQRPERLLMGILFWNLVINILFFSLASRVALSFDASSSVPALFTLGALMTIIVFGEFLPKSMAVLYPLVFIRGVALPLAFAIRVLDGFLPIVKIVNEGSRRLIWPGLKPEPYLELADLDRAVELSTDDSQLFEHERLVLRNIIRLSEIRVEEWMRPRIQYRTFKPPLSLDLLGGEATPSGYMLVTDDEGAELVGAVDLPNLLPSQADNLADHVKPLVVVPWCAPIAEALKQLRENDRRVAVIVNEYGETIGILTWDEIFEAVSQVDNARSKRALSIADVRYVSPGVWLATGMTKLRRLERVMGRRFEFSRSLTVGGVVQEQLRRLPEQGSVCQVQDLQFEVIEAGVRGETLVRISILPPAEGSPQ